MGAKGQPKKTRSRLLNWGRLRVCWLCDKEICREKRTHLDLDFGQPSHIEKMWRLVRESKVFRRKGDKVKLGRWSSWLNAHRSWRGEKSCLLLILGYMGMLRGWWKKCDGIPLVSGRVQLMTIDNEQGDCEVIEQGGQGAQASASSSSSAAAVAASTSASSSSAGAASGGRRSDASVAGGAPAIAVSTVAAGGVASNEPRTIRESNAALNRVRGRCVNTLHFAANVLSNFYGGQAAEVVDAALLPFSSYFDSGKTVCKTRKGSLNFHKDVASTGLRGVVSAAMDVLATPEKLENIDFIPPSELHNTDEGAKLHDSYLARMLFDLILSASKSYIMSGMTYSACYPGLFLLLVEPTDLERSRALLRMKHDFDLLTKVEKKALDDPFLKNVLRQMRWPAEQWVREVLVMLSEENFEQVTPEVQLQLNQFGLSWFGTNLNEDLFNKWRQRESSHSAGRFSRMSRWHCATTTTLLSDYDSQPVSVSPQAHQQGLANADKSLFEGSTKKFTLGAESFESLTSAGDWPHLTGQGMKLRGFVWECVKRLDGDGAKIRRAWLSLLVSPGHFVHLPENDGGLKGSA